MQLTPLSRSAVAELVGGPRPRPGGRPRPHGGQPVLRQPDPRPAGLAAAGERARRRVARTAALAPPERRALELLSCAPDGVSGELLAALYMPQTTVEALGATGLLDRRGRGVAFRHEIARSAVLEAVPPGAEPALHAAMIEALEAVGGDAERARPPRGGRRGRAADPAVRRRGGGRGRAVRGAPRGRRVLRARPAPHRRRRHRHPCRRARGPRPGAVPHRPARRRDRGAHPRRWRCAGSSATSSRSAPATAPSPSSSGTRRTDRRPSGRTRRRSRSCPTPAIPGRSATRSPTAPTWPRATATWRRAVQAGLDALRIADELGDAALHTAAAIGEALARLNGGDPQARADLLAAQRRRAAAAARRARDRADEPPRSPRRRAGTVRAGRGRRSPTPCGSPRNATSRSATCGSAGCRPGCGCCRAAGGRPSRSRSPCWRRGTSPWAGCGRTSCSGCSPPGGTRPRRTPTSTSCGGWRRSSTSPVCWPRSWRRSPSRPGSPRRPDPRLDGSLVAALAGLPSHGRAPDAPVGATAGRRRRPGPRRSGAAVTRPASRAPALRGGAGPVGRRVDRRAARRAPAAGRPGRPRRRRARARAAARARGDEPAPRPVTHHPGQPGRAHRTAARRAGPARPRA